MKENATNEFPSHCFHCKERLGMADRTQTYICPVCGRVRCILCHSRVCKPKVVIEDERDRRAGDRG